MQYEISTTKQRLCHFQIRNKNYQIIEQVSHFDYLANDIGCDKNFDIDVKLGEFQANYGIVKRIFKNVKRR